MLESGSIISSSITLAVAAIGAGMLAFPLAFANLGLVAATISLFVIAAFTVISFYYLALGIERLGLCSYEDLTRVLLGLRYEKGIRIMLVALNFGVAVCYVVVVGEMMVPLQPEIRKFVAAGPFGALLGSFVSTPSHCLAIVWLVVMLPLSMTRSMSALRYTTALAICASVYIVLAVAYREVSPSADQGQCEVNFRLWNGATDADGNVQMMSTNARHRRKLARVIFPSNTEHNVSRIVGAVANSIKQSSVEPAAAAAAAAGGSFVNTIYLFNVHSVMFLALPIIGYSIDCQCFVFQLYCDLKPSIRSAWTMGKVAGLSMALACFMYFVVGTFGYLSFGERTRGNILQNYNPTEDYVMAVGYTLYSVPVVMAYALTIFPLRDAIFNYLYGVSAAEQQSVIPALSFYAWSMGVSVATLVFGILTPGIVVIIGLLGAMCSSTLCFTLPACYRIQMHRRGLLPFGTKSTDDQTESLPMSPTVATDSMRQQGEVQKILQKEATSGSNNASISTGTTASSAAADNSGASVAIPPANYGSIVDVAQTSSDAELASIPVTGKDISIPLSPAVDATLAYSMLWLGIISGVLGTVAATLNMVVGIGS